MKAVLQRSPVTERSHPCDKRRSSGAWRLTTAWVTFVRRPKCCAVWRTKCSDEDRDSRKRPPSFFDRMSLEAESTGGISKAWSPALQPDIANRDGEGRRGGRRTRKTPPFDGQFGPEASGGCAAPLFLTQNLRSGAHIAYLRARTFRTLVACQWRGELTKPSLSCPCRLMPGTEGKQKRTFTLDRM